MRRERNMKLKIADIDGKLMTGVVDTGDSGKKLFVIYHCMVPLIPR